MNDTLNHVACWGEVCCYLLDLLFCLVA